VKPLIDIRNLKLQLGSAQLPVSVLEDVNLSIYSNEFLGLIGPSGSGKSMCIRAIIRLVESYPYYNFAGEIIYTVDDQEVNIITAEQDLINRLRREDIGIIFQQSANILNPSIKIGNQIGERHGISDNYSKIETKESVLRSLEKVGLTPAEKFYNAYPHELSGGQLQRCLIAMAIIMKPKLLLADEPCSNLDISSQTEIIKLLQTIQEEYDMSILFVSHDRELVDSFCDRVVYISDGMIIDAANNPSKNEFQDLSTDIDVQQDEVQQDGGKRDVILELVDVSFSYRKRGASILKRQSLHTVLNNFSMTIHRGSIHGIVGLSGCGKSTIAKIFCGILQINSGIYRYEQNDVSEYTKSDMKKFRKSVQMIFQDSHAAMPPHLTVYQLLKDTAKVHAKSYDDSTMMSYLDRVGLDMELLYRLPHQLSGGQRQRFLIAKALLTEPELLICDEILSSIDANNKQGILNILKKLNRESELTILFITHDLSIIKTICDKILVMT